jgi:hypothetical protein
MNYTVITTAGTFEFTLGQIGVTKGNVGARDADGTAHAYQGAEIIAMMRADFKESYQAALAELEQLKNRNGH